MELPTQSHPARILVREGFTDQDVWREALGNMHPLAVFAMTEARMDAKEYMPAGGMKSALANGKPNPLQIAAWRE